MLKKWEKGKEEQRGRVCAQKHALAGLDVDSIEGELEKELGHIRGSPRHSPEFAEPASALKQEWGPDEAPQTLGGCGEAAGTCKTWTMG